MKKMIAKNLEKLREDLIDIKIVDRYWENVKKGDVIKESGEEFLRKLEKW